MHCCLVIHQKSPILQIMYHHTAFKTYLMEWASLVTQLVENPPAMQEPWVGKIPWRREWLASPVFWPGEFHGQRSLTGYIQSVHGVAKSLTQLSDIHFHHQLI